MVSLRDIVSPDLQERKAEQEAQLQYDSAQMEGPTKWDLAKASFESSYMNTIGISALAKRIDAMPDLSYSGNSLYINQNNTKYTENQLHELYPDAPKDYFKGGATPFQAELLYDRLKKQETANEIQNFIYGNEDKSQTDWWIAGRGGRDLIPNLASLGGGLADPLNLAIGPIGGMLGKAITTRGIPALATLAPDATSSLVKTIATSRFLSNVVPEVLGNFAADLAVTYPTEKFITSEYDKKEANFVELMKNSVASSLVFGSLRGIFKGYNYNWYFDATERLQDTVNNRYSTNRDTSFAHMGDTVQNEAVFKRSLVDEIINPGSKEVSTLNTMAAQAHDYSGPLKLTYQSEKFYALADKKEGNIQYLGTRYGDNVVLIDSPQAIEGTIHQLNNGSANDYEIYSIDDVAAPKLKLAPIADMKLNDYPTIIDIAEQEFGGSLSALLNDNSTIKDLYDLINKSSVNTETSGADVVRLFKDMNAVLEKAGYDGITHVNELGASHTVAEIFQNKSSDILVKEGDYKGVATDTAPMLEKSPFDDKIVLADGSTIEAEAPVAFDPYYDLDDNYKKGYNDLQNPDLVSKETFDVEKLDTVISDIDKEVKAELDYVKENINQLPERYHGTSSKLPNQLLDTETYGAWEVNNIYGNGFYSTDSADIGKKYMKKGKGNTPSLYKVSEITDVKAFNLDEKMNSKIHNELTKIAEDFDYQGDGYFEEIMNENSSLGKALDAFRREGRSIGLDKGTFQEMVLSMQDYLKTLGYGAFDHEGGNLTKGKKHNVRIYWDPNKQIKVDLISDNSKEAMIEKNNEKIAQYVDDAKTEHKNNYPDKLEEISKALENCGRKK